MGTTNGGGMANETDGPPTVAGYAHVKDRLDERCGRCTNRIRDIAGEPLLWTSHPTRRSAIVAAHPAMEPPTIATFNPVNAHGDPALCLAICPLRFSFDHLPRCLTS